MCTLYQNQFPGFNIYYSYIKCDYGENWMNEPLCNNFIETCESTIFPLKLKRGTH